MNRKYRLLFTPKLFKKPGPKGPSKELIKLIVEMKLKNPLFGCPRIAMQIKNAFGIEIDKDVVRRVLAKYYKPVGNDQGPSWLSFLGNMKDSLWSVDFFRLLFITINGNHIAVAYFSYQSLLKIAIRHRHVLRFRDLQVSFTIMLPSKSKNLQNNN